MISRKILFVLLTVALCAAGVWATGAKEEAAKPVTLKYFSGEHPNTPIKGDSPVMQEFTKKTGVTIEFQTVPNGQETEKLNVIFASGEYPDLINAPAVRINEYADKVFIQLDSLIDKYGANVKKILTPDTKAMILNADGRTFAIPRMGQPEQMLGWLLRQDWLTKLNLKEPKTLDEWVTVLKAFKEKDPDGNGKADTTPLTARGWPAYAMVGPSYGLNPDARDTFWQPENGEVKMMLDSPAFKEMLTFIRSLTDQELLDKEFTVIKTPQWEEKMIGSKSGAAMDYVIRADMCNVGGQKIDPKYKIYVTEFPKGPRGERGMRVYNSVLPGYSIGVTKSCKNTEAAMRWINYVWSDEGATLFSFGIQGTSWDLVNGKKTFIGDYAKLDNALMAKLMIQPNVFPFRMDVDAMDYMWNKNYPEGNAGYKLNAAWKVYPLPVFAYTKEENETLKDWNANVVPLIMQYRDGIAVGTRPLSDWDELVTKVKGMGYDKYTNVIKAAYARYKVLLSK